jgi:Ca-activated chloride channel homolog
MFGKWCAVKPVLMTSLGSMRNSPRILAGFAVALTCSALIPALIAGETDGQMEPSFHTTSQMVLVPVTVTDRNNRIVDGLRAEDLTISDDKVRQRITWFGSDDAPCSVAVVLDVSGSMQRALTLAKDLLRTFFGTANSADEFLLLTVSTRPAAIPGFTSEIAQIQEGVRLARPGGMTALFDTTYLALRRMKEARRSRRGLLILSDGKDNHSQHSFSELMSLAVEADVQIYAMTFDTDTASTSTMPFRRGLAQKTWDREITGGGPEMLEKLSNRTGGLSFHVRNDTEAREAAIATSQALRNEYLAGFEPSNANAPGRWHEIRVKSNLPNTFVHARHGYYSHN